MSDPTLVDGAEPATDQDTAPATDQAADQETEETPLDSSSSDGADPAEKPQGRAGGGLRILAFGVLPAVALVLALGVGYLKWLEGNATGSAAARAESIQAATDTTVAMLSYRPDSVEQDLATAQDRLTGPFRDSYGELINDVVIPGAKQQNISAVATVPAAAAVSATPDQAVVIVFVNQTTIIGNDAPTNSASSVRVTLDKVGSQWLVSDFTPV